MSSRCTAHSATRAILHVQLLHVMLRPWLVLLLLGAVGSTASYAQVLGRTLRDSLREAGRSTTTIDDRWRSLDLDEDGTLDTLVVRKTFDVATGGCIGTVPRQVLWGYVADTSATVQPDTTTFDIVFTGGRRAGLYLYDEDGDGIRDMIVTVRRVEHIKQAAKRSDRADKQADSVVRARVETRRWVIHGGTALRERSTCTFNGAAPGATEAAWITAAEHVDTTQTQLVVGGSYAIRRIAAGGEFERHARQAAEATTDASRELPITVHLTAAPNPASDHVRLTVTGTKVPEGALLRIADARGRVVRTMPWQVVQADGMVTVAQLPAGTYSINVVLGSSVVAGTTIVIVR